MSTYVAAIPAASRIPGRRYDRVFFPIMAALILASVFLGFAKTYYLAGLIHAPLPSWIIHVHGAIFSSWIILLMVQIGLVSARRVDLHKKLGLAGFGLACLMVIFGLLAAQNALSRGFSPLVGVSPGTFFIVPVTDIVVFAILIYFGYTLRSNSAAHKRIMMIATLGILDAAIARWPFALIQTGPHFVADACLYAFFVLLAGYDLWSTHKIHRATLWGSLFVIVVQQVRIPIALTHPWLRLADMALGKF
jgi:hypothetical protein